MFPFCIKADRAIGETLTDQLDACSLLQINNIELGAVIDGTPLIELPGDGLEDVRNELIARHKRIVLLDADFTGYEEARINLLLRKAHLLHVESVCPVRWEGEESLDSLNQLLSLLLPMAKSYGIGVVLENRRGSCLSHEKALAEVMHRWEEYRPGWVFNPLEFAAEKRHPFFHVFYNTRLKPAILFLRVNDGLFADGSAALPAQGNAEIKEMASALLARSFSGYFSYCPYLPEMGIDHYAEVIDRFQRLLMAM